MVLHLSDVKKKLPFKVSTGLSMESVERFVENHYRYTFDFDVYLPSKDKNLQRPLIWTRPQKQEFILSILKGITIPPLSIIQYRSKPGTSNSVTLKFIDGKQRFTTATAFYKNEFPIIVNGICFWFKDLDTECKNLIAFFGFTFNVAYEYDYDMISDEDKIAWFEQINFFGTPQDKTHLKDLKG